MRTAPLALALALTLSAAAPIGAVAEDDAPRPFLRLEYRVVTTNESTDAAVKRNKPLVPRTEGMLTTVLGPRRVEIAEETRRVVLDHETSRTLRVDAEGGYRATSMLASVAFIEMEMQNRVRLAKVLARAKMSDESARPRELSILFGWPADGDDTKIATARDGDAYVFTDGDEELARFTPSPDALDAAQSASLDRFLQHRCRLHPAVRAAIVAAGHAPAALRYRWLNTGTRSSAEFTLTAATRAGADALLPLARRVFDEKDALARAAQRVLEPSEKDAVPRLVKEDFVRLSAAARDAGRLDDAALLLVECGLQTGDEMTDELRALRSAEGADEKLTALFDAIGNRDPAKGLAALDALDRAHFTRPYVFDVFRANALAGTRRIDDAVKTMLTALDANPWLTGAWKDLGDFYYARFDTDRTWLAWEAGRRAKSDHPMWQPVNAFEEHLRTTFARIL